MTQDTVDIIIAAKNESHAIAQCLTAIAEQTYPQMLVKTYVVDHGSTDDTAEIVRSFKVELLQLKGGSVGSARNLAIAKGSGKFLAFIDAHSIPERDWLLNMTNGLKDSSVAGCQGAIENAFQSARIERWAAAYGLSTSQQWERWQSGHWTAYPFIATCNAICRRQAVEEVGLFDESLMRCEDLDLSWRLVLAGYQLSLVSQGKVLHFTADSWFEFLIKHFRSGRSMAHIAGKYALNRQGGLWPIFGPDQAPSAETGLIRLLSLAGYLLELVQLKTARVKPALFVCPPVKSELRRRFAWNSGTFISLSPGMIYWTGAVDEYTAVDLRTMARFVFAQTAFQIFHQLVQGSSRAATIDVLQRCYRLDAAELANDIDDFVEQLLSQGLLVRHSSSDMGEA